MLWAQSWLTVLWNLLEICPLGCWGKLFMGSCLFGGTLIENCSRRVLGKLQVALRCRTWESVSTPGAGYWRSPVPSTVPLRHPLLSELNIVPVDEGKPFKGPDPFFLEQAKRVNLKSRGSKPKTSREIYAASYLIPKRLGQATSLFLFFFQPEKKFI